MKDIILQILSTDFQFIKDKEIEVHGIKFNWSIFAWKKNERINDNYIFLNISSKNFIKLHKGYSSDIQMTENTLKEQWIYELKRIVSKLYIENNKMTDKDWEKNITLIIVLDCSSYDPRKNEVDANVLFDFEENPYSFRKNILFYTDEEIQYLKNELKGHTIYDDIYKIILKKEYFESYKNNKSPSALVYSLVSQLFIKIPFLNLPKSNNVEALTNLMEKIDERLHKGDLKSLKNKLLDIDINDLTFSDKKILEKLMDK